MFIVLVSRTLRRLPHGSKSSFPPREFRRYIDDSKYVYVSPTWWFSFSSLRLAVTVDVMDFTSLLCPRCCCELRVLSSLLMKGGADKMPAIRDVLYVIAAAYWVALHYSSHSCVHQSAPWKCTIWISNITSSTGRESFSDVLLDLFWLVQITALLSAHDRLMLRTIANLHRVIKPWNRSPLLTIASLRSKTWGLQDVMICCILLSVGCVCRKSSNLDWKDEWHFVEGNDSDGGIPGKWCSL